MKIVVMTDVHGNLPALQAALAAISNEGYDAILHLGDVVGIGPFPAECLDLLLNQPNIRFIMGNHDAWFANGLPNPQPTWMSDGEVEHQQWTHEQLDSALKATVSQWPYLIQDQTEDVTVSAVHYALQSRGDDFQPIMREPSISDLENLFEEYDSDLVFYGHHHPFADAEGKARYINPGSLGCSREPVARYTVVTFHQGSFMVEHRTIPYCDALLISAFEERRVPERKLLYRMFYGGRFSS